MAHRAGPVGVYRLLHLHGFATGLNVNIACRKVDDTKDLVLQI